MEYCRVVSPRGLCRPLDEKQDEKQGFPTNTSRLAPCQGCSKAEQSRTTFREEAAGRDRVLRERVSPPSSGRPFLPYKATKSFGKSRGRICPPPHPSRQVKAGCVCHVLGLGGLGDASVLSDEARRHWLPESARLGPQTLLMANQAFSRKLASPRGICQPGAPDPLKGAPQTLPSHTPKSTVTFKCSLQTNVRIV